MKPKKITWSTERNTIKERYGLINGFIWFIVREVGKKNPKYKLLSYPISNPNFTRANSAKNLGEFETEELAQEKAQEIFNEFVNSLTE